MRIGRRALTRIRFRAPPRSDPSLPGSDSGLIPPGLKQRNTWLGGLDELETYYRSIRPWLLPRIEDSTLIVPPNQVFKLAGSAFPLFSWLDQGGRLRDLPGMDEARYADLQVFFDQLRAAYTGDSTNRRGEFGRTAYDFTFTGLPVLGEIALTYRCNEKCRFCYASCGDVPPSGSGKAQEGRDPARAELSTEGFRQVIRIFKEDAKIPFFSFTGGEPLLRVDLEELASYAGSLGLRTNLITNGSLASDARAASLKAAGIDTAQVSLESPDGAIHDELCGRVGTWDRTVAGIRALQRAGISVQTNSTLTAINKESLAKMPEFLARLGITRFSMNLFIPSGRGIGDEELLVRYSETGGFVENIRKKAKQAGLTFFWYSPTPYCIYNPVAKGLGNKSCAAMDGLIHVNPYGEILPCSSWPESVGDIRARPFGEIWFSERARFFKEKHFAPAACEGCGSFVACQGACPLYFRVLGETEIERARGVIHGK